ncbi:uncharacterized protein B0P05DRAFT_557082 [Gilbertella persicaria]|uniref:uncharacterized protein n=1 Tax=Gilbertella persicaria TaxID=101096 RepID=UPI0022202350|nr:uncharacterized protein B0P05DRAFT_557082 [Gilbertella persicaria]KAI8061877.1 hypothetical protein B0P05DRAFT_557082 [Gilbertella persicaria]
MMNFEDIVDMEWFDSHTAPIDTSFLPPSPPMTTADDNVMLSLPSGTTAMDLLAYQHKAGKEISMMALPPIDQIKQLIEVATENISNTVSPESLIKSTPGQDAQMERDEEEEEEEEEESGPPSPSSLSSSSEQPMTLEAYAKTDGIDIRNLSSKERRQLRNKISARNFRIRRKGEKK